MSRIEFGEQLLRLVNAPEWIKLCVAKSLPRPSPGTFKLKL